MLTPFVCNQGGSAAPGRRAAGALQAVGAKYTVKVHSKSSVISEVLISGVQSFAPRLAGCEPGMWVRLEELSPAASAARTLEFRCGDLLQIDPAEMAEADIVLMEVCICACLYVYIYIYIHTYTYYYVIINVYDVCVCIYIYMYIYIYKVCLPASLHPAVCAKTREMKPGAIG